MPGYSCSVKERMLYSSCKAPLIDLIESNLGLTISKKVCIYCFYFIYCNLFRTNDLLLAFKLEIDADEELTEKYLIEEIHPTKVVDKPKFEKPKGPPSRGAKRLTKPQKV